MQISMIPKNVSAVTKIEMSNCEKTQIVTKLKKINCNKNKKKLNCNNNKKSNSCFDSSDIGEENSKFLQNSITVK